MCKTYICNYKTPDITSCFFKKTTNFFSTPNELYPCFSNWHKKISTEIFTPSRSFIIVLEDNKIAGFSILKHTNDENKICTFYIDKLFRKNKIGTLLMKSSLDVLHNNAIITINEKLVDMYYPLLNRFDFYNVAIKNDYYRLGQKEYFFKR